MKKKSKLKIKKKVNKKKSKITRKNSKKPLKKNPLRERIRSDKPNAYYVNKLQNISQGTLMKMKEWLYDYYMYEANHEKEPDWSKGSPIQIIKAIDMIYEGRIDGFILRHPSFDSPLDKNSRLRSYTWDIY